jgi:N utilization substance protein B
MKVTKDPRHSARRLTLSSIFCWLFSEPDEEQCLVLSKELLDIDSTGADLELTERIIRGVKEHREEIDKIIEKCAPEWPLEKISKIDLVILRMSIFEMLYEKETPQKVVIDEAVELAKEFGNDTSCKFINGVLGSVLEQTNE